MDLESAKGLGIQLYWGAPVFLTMRFGCGARGMGRRGHHRDHDAPAGNDGEKDPACGMGVVPGKAAGASVCAGRTFYFCSAHCRDKFEMDPAKYTAATRS